MSSAYRREKILSTLKRVVGSSPRLKAALKPLYQRWSTDTKYHRWIEKHVDERAKSYKSVIVPKGQFSIVTTAWNTPREFLRTLAESLKHLDGFDQSEWVILNNGSTSPSTLAELNLIRSWPNVKLLQVPENIGIIGGMRLCLENASGNYILPVDSDDEIYPDSLKILQFHIEKNDTPALLYSDEDKIAGGIRRDPYRKPDWDPVLFYHSCYIAHLCAIDRKKALALGVYTNPKTNGSHDWDTFSRFHIAGLEPVHVPEILYSWRMHEGSTAGNIRSKDYIFSSHKEVLNQFVRHCQLEGDIEVKTSPLFNGTPDWQFSPVGPTKDSWAIFSWGNGVTDLACHLDGALCPEWRSQTLADCCRKIVSYEKEIEGKKVLLANRNVDQVPRNTLAQAGGLFRLFSDTGCVSGRVIGRDELVIAGDFRERQGELKNEYRGFHRNEYGYFAQALKPHSIDSASPLFALWRGELLVQVARLFLEGQNFERAAATVLKNAKLRIIYDPLLECHLSPESAHFNPRVFKADYSQA